MVEVTTPTDRVPRPAKGVPATLALQAMKVGRRRAVSGMAEVSQLGSCLESNEPSPGCKEITVTAVITVSVGSLTSLDRIKPLIANL
jgi:hypothetical protein